MPILVTAPPCSQHCHSIQWPARDVQTSGACFCWASPGVGPHQPMCSALSRPGWMEFPGHRR
eukprot:758513-Alexandrium_andersonii.AAC.1